MEFRLPTLNDYDALKDYVEEHFSNQEKSISASMGLFGMKYEDWVEKINRAVENPEEDWGRYLLYLVFDQNKLIGLLSIRYELSDELRQLYGDIGYGVRPSERRKGYATQMLEFALKVCKEKGMSEVILGCYERNLGSNKTILNNNGVLYRTEKDEFDISDTWSVSLKDNFYKIKL